MKIFILLTVILFLRAGTTFAQPQPRDIYKEFIHNPDFETIISDYPLDVAELDPYSKYRKDTTSGFYNKPTAEDKKLEIDLDLAIKAELTIEYWGGHIGTSEQKFKVNGNDWIYIPQPVNTSGNPECYHRVLLGNSSVPIPLSQLKKGSNNFQFSCGPQLCYGWDMGFYWIYSFIVRVYYDKSKPHSEGYISSHSNGDKINDNPIIKATLTKSSDKLKQVDFIGYFEDFNWEGNGIFKQWHYQTNYGRMVRHIGKSDSKSSPYSVAWENKWVPDQDGPIKLMARIMDNNGVCYMTPDIEGIVLKRDKRSVKMYKAYDVPEKFSSRIGEKMSCKIDVTQDMANATQAKMVVSTWSGKSSDGSLHQILLNGKLVSDNFGRFHNYSYDMLNVPLYMIKKGMNEVMIHSEFQHHMLEVNWPGPVVLIEYKK